MSVVVIHREVKVKLNLNKVVHRGLHAKQFWNLVDAEESREKYHLEVSIELSVWL